MTPKTAGVARRLGFLAMALFCLDAYAQNITPGGDQSAPLRIPAIPYGLEARNAPAAWRSYEQIPLSQHDFAVSFELGSFGAAAGRWTSCHSHTPTQKRTHSGYPLRPLFVKGLRAPAASA